MPESLSQNVGGALVVTSATFARPANTTAYTAGDVVSNNATTTVALKFNGATRLPGGSGAIVKARLDTDLKTEVAQYRLYLYSKPATGLTIAGDNVAHKTLYADRAASLGFLDFPACGSGADTSGSDSAFSLWTGTLIAFQAYAGSGAGTSPNTPGENAIYGVLVNITGTTPASAQNFAVTLTIVQN